MTISLLACQIMLSSAATTLSGDGSWTQFRWFGAGGSLDSLEGPFTFIVPSGSVGIFDVTDAFEIGDRFTVTDDGSVLGVTPPASGDGFTRDPDVAFASPLWSSSRFELGAGSHSVQLETTTLANGQTLGGAFIRLNIEALNALAWQTPSAIVYGTPLSSTQLNASVDGIDGTFVYQPSIGTVLPAGTGHVLSVTFTPNDTSMDPLTTSVSIDVLRAPLAMTIASASRPFGQANPPFTASYAGFVNNESVANLTANPTLTSPATPSSPPGSYPITASGTFDPNYAISVTNGTLTVVNGSELTLAWSSPPPITYGTPLSAAQLNAVVSDSTPGVFSYSPSIGTVLPAGTHVLSVTFTPSDENESPIGASTSISVERAPLLIRADDQVATLTTVSKPISFVEIGNPGNAPNTELDGQYGAVATSFEMAKFEITNALYAEFLNAVGKADPTTNGQFSNHPPLYNGKMEREARGGIVRTGTSPNFSYQVKPNMGNKPVIFTSFWDACRLCNWLHNGKPSGAQVASTTEDGAYDLTDPNTVANNSATRKPGARYFIPTEDEWYKAAFHDPTADDSYRRYPTGQDSLPTPALADTQGNITNPGSNVANYGRNADWDSNGNGTVETEIMNGLIGAEDGGVTSVGGTGSESFYGVADMSGNASEWTETPLSNWGRVQRGGSWNGSDGFLPSSYSFPASHGEEVQDRGIRIASISGPIQEWILPNLTVSYFGLINGDTPASLGSSPSITTTAGVASPTGNYPITVSGGFAANYNITFESGTLLLNEKANPTIQWSVPAVITYGSTLTTSALNTTATHNGSTVSGTFVYDPPLGTVLNRGSHEQLVTFLPSLTSTYNPITTKASLTVSPAPLTIRADDVTLQSADFTLTASYLGLVNGDAPDDLYVPVTLSTVATGDSAPGTYPITAQGASSPNYAISFEPGSLTRPNRIVPNILWSAPAPLVYGSPLSSGELNATIDQTIGGSLVYTPPLGTLLSPSPNAVLEVRFDPDNTFLYGSTTSSVSIQIQKAPLTITINDVQRAAGSENPSFGATYAGFVLGETSASLTNPLVITSPATRESAPGTYPISGSIGEDPRYAITITNGSLTIADKLIPASTWSTPAALTYGQALTPSQLNATVTDSVLGVWEYAPTLGTILNAGTTTLTATFTPSDSFAYESVSASTNLTVNPAPLTVRALDLERRVGESNPSLRASYTGFVNGESSADLDQQATMSTTATADSEPGTYAIIVQGAMDPNYSITFVNGSLTITDKLIPVATWNSPAALTYGQALTAKELNATVADGVLGAWEYAPGLGTILNAGTTTLTATFTPTDSSIYASVSASTSLTVNPAPLTVRALDLERRVGESNPSLSASYTGFVNGESSADLDQQATMSTTATADSEPGTYAIIVQGAMDPNYSIIFINGSLTVLAREILPLPELTLRRDGDRIVVSWKDTEGVRLVHSETLEEWEPVLGTEVTMLDGLSTWTSSPLSDDDHLPLVLFRLERFE